MATNKYVLGSLILVVLASSYYIMLPEEVKLLVSETSSTFYVWEDKWVVSGIETNKLYNGTKLFTATNRKVTNTIQDNITNITRTANFGKSQLIDNYIFDGNTEDEELFPIEELHQVINGTGLIYQYQVTKLIYNNGNKDIIDLNAYSFGRNMKIEWEGKPYFAKITQQTSGYGTLTLKYRIASDDETYKIRLFDPWWNTSWNSTRALTNNSVISPAVTDYQFSFNITRGSCNANFSDLRFTAIDNTTILSYWIENNLTGVWAQGYFKGNSTAGLIQAYAWCGNPTASNTSSFFNTFMNGSDDFSGTLTDRWIVYGSASINSGWLNITGNNNWNANGVQSKTNFTRPFVLEWNQQLGSTSTEFNNEYSAQTFSATSGAGFYGDQTSSNLQAYITGTGNQTGTQNTNIESFKIIAEPVNTYNFSRNGTNFINTKAITINNSGIFFQVYSNAKKNAIKNVIIRKYMSPEPSVSIGAEQTQTTPDVNITLYLNGTSADRFYELGNPVNITACANVIGTTVYINTTHPSLTNPLENGTTCATYLWNNSNVVINQFNNSDTTQNHSANNISGITINSVTDIQSGSMYLSGSLNGSTTIISTDNQSRSSWNEIFTGNQNNTFGLKMKGNVNLSSASLNISGFSYAGGVPVENKRVTQAPSILKDNGYETITNLIAINDSDFSTNAYHSCSGTPCVGIGVSANFTYNSEWVSSNTFNLSVIVKTNASNLSGNTLLKLWNYTSSSLKTLSNVPNTNVPQNITINNLSITDFVSLNKPMQFNIFVSNGYTGEVSSIYELQIYWYNGTNPTNPYIDVANSNTPYEWNYTGNYTGNNNTNLNVSLINTYCSNPLNIDGGGDCTIPILIHSDSSGILQISNINLVSAPILPYNLSIDIGNDGVIDYWLPQMSLNDTFAITNVFKTNTATKSLLFSRGGTNVTYIQAPCNSQANSLSWNVSGGNGTQNLNKVDGLSSKSLVFSTENSSNTFNLYFPKSSTVATAPVNITLTGSPYYESNGTLYGGLGGGNTLVGATYKKTVSKAYDGSSILLYGYYSICEFGCGTSGYMTLTLMGTSGAKASCQSSYVSGTYTWIGRGCYASVSGIRDSEELWVTISYSGSGLGPSCGSDCSGVAYISSSFSGLNQYNTWNATNVTIFYNGTTLNYNYTLELNSSNPKNINLSSTNMNSYLSTCTQDSCPVPYTMKTNKRGNITISGVNINYTNSISDITFDVISDGVIDASISGNNIPNNNITIGQNGLNAMNNYISTNCVNNSVSVPIVATSATAGTMSLSNLVGNFSINPININTTAISQYMINKTGNVQVPIKYTADYWGKLNTYGLVINALTDYNYSFTGWSDATHNATQTVKLIWSNFSMKFPQTWIDYTEFVPKSITSKNVTPVGQTAEHPIYNFTYLAREQPMNISIWLNESINSCVNITASTTSNKTDGRFVNTTSSNQIVSFNSTSGTKGIWMWVDFQCTYPISRWLAPNFMISSKCESCN